MAFCKSPAATVKLWKAIKLNEWHAVMPGAGTEAGFRKPRVCEALPNAEQGRNKAKLTTTALP